MGPVIAWQTGNPGCRSSFNTLFFRLYFAM